VRAPAARCAGVDLHVGRLAAVVDTGAQRTIGNQALRTALNRTQRKWQQEEIIGVTLDVERGDNIRTPPIAFGRATITSEEIVVAAVFDFMSMSGASDVTCTSIAAAAETAMTATRNDDARR